MERITIDRLHQRLDLLNSTLGLPLEPHTFINGQYQANPSYSIGQAYGGYRLERNGGSVDVSRRGTKREIWEFIGAMLDGIEAERRRAS